MNRTDPTVVDFHFDPICPFAWVTSRWVVQVAERRPIRVDWRFIALRFVNEGRNYETDFPAGYPVLHDKGLRLLRVAAAARAHGGNDAAGRFYTEVGRSIWDRPPGAPGGWASSSRVMDGVATAPHLAAVLRAAGLPSGLAAAVDDPGHDVLIRAETDLALARAGRDLGTPVITVDPPLGPAFFGPVISRVPDGDDAERLWDAVLELARWPGFAEIKRSLREAPQLALLERRPDPSADQPGRR